jgi:hypothetical protein
MPRSFRPCTPFEMRIAISLYVPGIIDRGQLRAMPEITLMVNRTNEHALRLTAKLLPPFCRLLVLLRHSDFGPSRSLPSGYLTFSELLFTYPFFPSSSFAHTSAFVYLSAYLSSLTLRPFGPYLRSLISCYF